jgi:predicted NUDIX family NTP pyrophosphohydrolase
MPKQSAGLMMYRGTPEGLEVFLVHPGGPFFAHKDRGAWTIPKGELESGEDALLAAQREFKEETGFTSMAPFIELGTVRQASGKLVAIWAFAGDCGPSDLKSNTCLIDWPPRSGRVLEISEVDRCDWFSIAKAREYIRKEQLPALDRLGEILSTVV